MMVDNFPHMMTYYSKPKCKFKSELAKLKCLDKVIWSTYTFKSALEKLAFVQKTKQTVYSPLTHPAGI